MSETVLDTEARVRAAVERLADASAHGTTVAPVRDLIDRDDVVAAYDVQRRLTQLRVAGGATVVGRKIGLTATAVQQQLGVDQPDFGVLFDEMAHPDGSTVPFEMVPQARVEAEVAFVLGSDLDTASLDMATVRAAVDHVVAALEICGSRIDGWDISLADTVADNASAGAFVLGTERRTLEEVEPGEVVMELTIDGEVVSWGSGAACLGDPLNALLWLARRASELGDPLRAGQVVLSGALGPMRAVAPGAEVTAAISGLGRVGLRFGEGGG
ncbi:MAG TPA: fumarylacetoacetate hydrolase family protein [Nocardioides sp.]|uniref:2-keto-4-pentenoate hydratase n=1 Tax=Nocardioides sp. TaxID=35761 RepID=UPI002E36D46A|nr:fumarylacetoacetate hydrolase family protein [Nocardioides sp.]HEX3930011.1 fumarylacetoacetate hydrolase family protein [Nocardioides sp.]